MTASPPPDPALEARFLADVRRNPHNACILDRWDTLQLPDGWLVAGCLFQTVWNQLSDRPPTAGIHDYDLFYFDPHDLSDAGERAVQQRVDALLADQGITLEVCNQARVHLWYPSHFGEPYPRLHSSRDGIDRFLIPATCVGVAPGRLYAPYGLEGLYAGELTMNPLIPHAALYARKAASYQARWPWLRVAPAAMP